MAAKKKFSKQDYERIKGEHPGLVASLMTSLLHSFIADGRIDPKGKTLKQIKIEFIRESRATKTFLPFAGHIGDLSSEAAKAFEAEKFGLAVALWATLLEHEINLLLTHSPGLRDFPKKLVTSVMKDSSLRNKLILIHALHGAKAPPETVLGALENFSSTRNQYIHYKWPILNDEKAEEREEKEFKNACGKYPIIVDHLRAFEIRQIKRGFNGQFIELKNGSFKLTWKPRKEGNTHPIPPPITPQPRYKPAHAAHLR